MTCPPALAAVLLDLLSQGILRARAAAWAGDAERAAVEADHVHNLPGLLRDYSPERLKYYWEAERPAFLAQLPPDEGAAWEALWRRLRSQADFLHEPSITA